MHVYFHVVIYLLFFKLYYRYFLFNILPEEGDICTPKCIGYKRIISVMLVDGDNVIDV